MRLCVAGSRNYTDQTRLEQAISVWLTDHGLTWADITLIEGGAPGADSLAKQAAENHHATVEEHPADWERYGRMAGPIRNRLMADSSDALIAFPLGDSRGTWGMIHEMNRRGKPVSIIQEER